MLTDPNLHKSVFLFAVVLFTAITAWTDTRWRRIPNKITLPMWIAGWLYQGLFFKLAGLLDGLYGFGIGFGLFFVLWMVGSAGGGDVKLMGALSVWLGPGLTLKVLLCSLIFVVLGTFVVVVSSVFSNGWKRTRSRFSAAAADSKAVSKRAETIAQRQKRRVMAFAVPVALATWSVLLIFQNEWLHRGLLNS
ncbi:MAG: A24 family peptidase [Planctomycetaceae bacterium]